ncbi:hypothetical protein F511_19672 [Dorcoceras hygrometricum]|uniref:CCHC-type domain-containing protein n=1 Tax=Dorcoceras hygrometricum TaxID=472368 RepID=A0A2Z7CAS0_9LAMI|nr:hypothetical protein F511_19672 [Dorcoceras hygrometricum]
MIRHDVRLAEPVDYRSAVNKALRAEQDWKVIEEERQLKRQAFQQKDRRQNKKPNNNQQESQEKEPLVVQPISAVPNSGTRPLCPTCKKNHSDQCLFGQKVCYTCGKQGHMSRECSQKRPLINSRAYIMTAAETPADTSAETGDRLIYLQWYFSSWSFREFSADGMRSAVERRADDRYRKEERYKRDDEDNERNVEKSKDKSKDKFKEKSSDRKMKTNSNKRFSRRHDRKVLVAEESTKSWADRDSDTSSSSSSSSDSEQEEVHCFMADQTDEDELFDFSNVEFTRDDLVIALNDMVKEYRKLSHSFEEAKVENISLKSSSADSSSDELEDTDILKTELSKLQAENVMLRNEISELKAEVAKSTVEMSSWNKANLTLQKLYESQKQASDKTGIGFNNSEFCEGETNTQSRPAHDKFNKMSFVKADMIYNSLNRL